MIRLYVALTLVVGALLYRYPAIRYDSPPGLAVGCRDLFSPGPYQTLHQGKAPVFLSRGVSHELSSESLYFVPPLGEGYIEYRRMGRDISYFAKPGEMYWNRESASYPVTDPEGRVILLLSGDLTAVRLMDRNGNLAAGAPLSGLLMTDYAFANDWPVPEKKEDRQPAAAVLFSGGPVYLVLYGSALQTYRLDLPESEHFFAKSIAIGHGLIAVHTGEGDGDYIRLYSVKSKNDSLKLVREMSAKLPVVFSHRIAMSIVEGGVLFSAAHRMGKVNNAGRLSWSANGQGVGADSGEDAETANPPPPRVEFQGDAMTSFSLSLAGNGSLLVVADSRGNPLVQSNRQVGPFRFLSLPAPSSGDAAAGSDGVTVEDRHTYCTIQLSPARK